MDLTPRSGVETTNKVPHPVLWVEGLHPECITNRPDSCYVRGFRQLSSFDPYPEVDTKYLLVRHRPGLEGRVVWLCLDTDNGNPELPGGKSWCWLFRSERQAKARVAAHRKSGWTRLSRPYKYVVQEEFGHGLEARYAT